MPAIQLLWNLTCYYYICRDDSFHPPRVSSSKLGSIPYLRRRVRYHRLVRTVMECVHLSQIDNNLYSAVPIFVASKRLGWLVQTALVISAIGMILILFVPVGMHQHVNRSSYLVESNLGTSGWNSGTAWILGICNCMYAFGGTDGGKCSFSA